MRNELLGTLLLAAISLSVGAGCASTGAAGSATSAGSNYFAQASSSDTWNQKIQEWQQRASRGNQVRATETVSNDSALSSFRSERRREMARNLVRWTQTQSQHHYREDGAIDHWATLEETLRRGQEDCDGLELLIYNGLKEAGFGESNVYRAVVYRTTDYQHHMVTLWFEDPQDPWVLDPTGAMTKTMVKMSQLRPWVALRVFSETAQYSVRNS